jgi:hypothetical protein
MTPPPPGAFADLAREFLQDRHHEWDALAQFITLHQDGEEIAFGTVAMMDPAIHPGDYPGIMTRTAHGALADRDNPARVKATCGYLLFFEAFAVAAPGEDDTKFQRRRFQRDQRKRRFHERPDAVEQAMASRMVLTGGFGASPGAR